MKPLIVCIAAFFVFVTAGVVFAGHNPASFTGCIKAHTGTLYNFAPGDSPSEPCRGGESEIHMSGGDIISVIAGAGLSGGGTNGDATLSVANSYQLPQVCTAGQVAKWNSGTSLWECAADLGGITSETDPQVGSIATDSVPRWDGSALITGALFNTAAGSIGIGTITPAEKLHVVGNAQLSQLVISSGGSTVQAAIRFSGDDNTGLFSPAADIIALTTNGIERIRVTSGGSVGIGTASPGAKLEVAGKIKLSGPTLTEVFADDVLDLRAGSFPTNSSRIELLSAPNFEPAIVFFTSNGPRMRITPNGNVGIGTEIPVSKLQVVGNYIQFPTISGTTPPAADCDSSAEAGRVVVRTDGTANLYICTGSTGWVAK